MMKGGTGNNQLSSVATGIRVQSSLYGVTIPVIYGTTRLEPKLIWAADFAAHRVGGSKKSGSKKGGTNYDYTCACDFLLAHWPVQAVLNGWINKSFYGTYPTVVALTVSGGQVTLPALPSDGSLLYVGGVALQQGYSQTLNDYGAPAPSTVSGTWQRPLWNDHYYLPNSIVPGTSLAPYTFTWAPSMGTTVRIAGGSSALDGQAVIVFYSYVRPGNSAAWQGALNELNLEFEPYLASGSEYVNHPDQKVAYTAFSGVGSTKFDLGTADSFPSMSFEVVGSFAMAPNNNIGTAPDAWPADIIQDLIMSGALTITDSPYAGTRMSIGHGLGINDYDSSNSAPAMHPMGALPATGTWVKLSIPIASVGLSAGSVITSVAFGVYQGKASFCKFGNLASPSWALDGTTMAAMTPSGTTAEATWSSATSSPTPITTGSYWVWGTSPTAYEGTYELQSAVLGSDVYSQWELSGASPGLTLAANDVLSVWVYIDPANVPSQMILQFYDGSSWSHRAFWGAELLDTFFGVSKSFGATLPIGDFLGDLTPMRNYCQVYGISVSLCMDTQDAARNWLQDLFDIANCAPVWSGMQLKAVPYCEVSGCNGGATFIAPTASGPVCYLDDSCFLIDGNTPPVEIDRTRQADADNVVSIECLDRMNNYNTAIVTEVEQRSVHQYGIRKGSTQGNQSGNNGAKQYHMICRREVAQKVGAALVKRSAFQRNTYKFSLPVTFSFLEAMDLVAITDARLGLAQRPVRLTSVKESFDEQKGWTLACEAEQFLYGLNEPTPMEVASVNPVALAQTQGAGNVNTPIFLQPTTAMSSEAQLWIVASGSASNYGGCMVFYSVDGGSTYNELGTCGQCTTGALTADYPQVADPDTTDTMAVNLSESNGSVTSQLSGAADTFDDPWYLATASGYEVVCPTTATLTAANRYNLTSYTRRGALGTSPVDHPSGSRCAVLDETILKVALPAGWIGVQVRFKFATFNQYGSAMQALSDCAVYTLTPQYTGGVIAGSSGGSGTTQVTGEQPSGTVNGTNTVFTLAHTPNPASSLVLYSTYTDAFMMKHTTSYTQGTDYTLSGNTITFYPAEYNYMTMKSTTGPPIVSSTLVASYTY